MPLLEKVRWGPNRKAAFLDWIRDELFQTLGDRSDLERKWENSIIQWRAQLPDGTVDWPFPDAANYELPLTSMHADPVLADMIQTFHAPEDYWTPVAKRPDRVTHASPLREAMTMIEKKFLKMRRVNLKAFLDNNVLGTAVYKNHWFSTKRSKRRYSRDGTSERLVVQLSQPRIDHVPLQRFYFPARAWSLDPDAQGGAEWVAQEFFVTPAQLDAWAEGSAELPGFDTAAVTKVKSWVADTNPPVDREIRTEDKYQPFRDLKIRLFEVHARFDCSGEGVEDDIVCIISYELPELLRAIYLPDAHGHRPFEVINYLPNFGIYGIGLAEIDEWAQNASTDILNAQLNNAVLANAKMYYAPLGSNIQPGEAIYPSKIWFVGPNEKIGELPMSDIHPSMFTILNQIMQFSDLRSGMPEIRQGSMSGLPSRTPATSLMAALNEGKKRFDMIHTGIRDVQSDMGLRMLQNVSQRAQEDPVRWGAFFTSGLGAEDAQKVMEVLLDGEVTSLEESFGISVTATSAQVNKEVEKQAFIGLLQMVSQIYGQLVQTAMLMAQVKDPVVQATAIASYESGVELLKRLLERFDIQNPKQYLANLDAISKGLTAQAQGQNAATGGLTNLAQTGGLGVLGAAQGIPPDILNQSQLGSLGGLR